MRFFCAYYILPMIIPQDIRDFRQAWHLSQTDLALMIGVSRRTICAWEAGTVPLTRIHKLAFERLKQITAVPEP